MKKNFIFVFALMFALALVSSGSVMAVGNVTHSANVNDRAVTNTAQLYLLNSGPDHYRLNLTLNLTHLNNARYLSNTNGTWGDDTSGARNGQMVQVERIRVTLPAHLSYVTGSQNGLHALPINDTFPGHANTTTNSNFSYSSSARTLTWFNTSENGINITSCAVNPTNVSVYKVSLVFNVTAIADSNNPLTVEVLYNDSTTWQTLSVAGLNLSVVNLSTATNMTTLRFNEDIYKNITININNSNIMNYPGLANLNSSRIMQINFTLSAGNLSITDGDGYNGSTANKRGTIINWTRVSDKIIQINSTESATNDSIIAGGIENDKNYTFTFQVLITQPGNYTLTITTHDNASRTNSTVLDITVLDTTIPSNITFSCSPSSLYLGEIVTCTCTPSWDNYYLLAVLTSSITATDTAQVGTYTETCTVTDGNGNQGTATASYTVNSAGESVSAGGGGAGSGYAGATTHNANTLSATTETTLTSKAEENIAFKTTTGTTAGTSFVGTVDALTETSATLTIVRVDGTNKAVTIDVGSAGKVDLDGDNVYDLSISLSSITDGKAKFAMKEISETVPLEEREEEVTEEGAEEEGGAEEVTKNLTWLWVALGIVVVIAVIFFLTQKKKSPVAVFFLTLFAKNGRTLKRR